MHLRIAAALAAAALASSCVVNNPSYIGPPQFARAADLEVVFVNAHGTSSGGARLWDTPRGVYISLGLAGAVSAGWHGVHFHEHGDCSGPSFASAGAHVGHASGKHGLINPEGSEAGDLPNVLVVETIVPAAQLFSPFVTLAPTPQNGRMPLRDADGSSLVVHANPDDQMSQPIGGAGDRVLCAIIPPAS